MELFIVSLLTSFLVGFTIARLIVTHRILNDVKANFKRLDDNLRKELLRDKQTKDPSE